MVLDKKANPFLVFSVEKKKELNPAKWKCTKRSQLSI